jgi:uncharacterized membrane protein
VHVLHFFEAERASDTRPRDAIRAIREGRWEEVVRVPVDVQTEIIIGRPPDVVAAYAADPSNAPEWYANIDSVEWKTSPPATVGSRVAFTARFLGRRLEYTYEFVDFVPGGRLVMRTAQGPFPMETTYTWTAVDGTSTRMTLRNRGEPAGFSKALAPFMVPAMRRANRKDLTRIKAILEST